MSHATETTTANRLARLGCAFSLAAAFVVGIDAAGTAASSAPAAPSSPARSEMVEAAPSVGGDTVVNLTPARFLDTRSGFTTVDGQLQGTGKRTGGSQLRVQIAGRGLVPADAEGVVVNVTAIEPEGNGFISVHPCVSPRPGTSSLNYRGGRNLGNEIVSALAADGSVCVFTRTATHVTLDVVGYVPAGSALTATSPARFFETRAGEPTVDGKFAGGGRTTAAGTVKIRVGGRAGIPTGVKNVIANVTAINPGLPGYLSAHACLSTRPPTSSLNFQAGVNRGNELVIPVDANGDICIFTLRPIDLTVDVLGYVPAGTNFTSIIGARLAETRPGFSTVDGQFAGGGQAAAESELRVKIAGRAGIPSAATGVVLNLTAITPGANGFMIVHPCVTPRPNASSLNYSTGVTGGNEIIAGLNAAGELCVFTKRASDFTVDVTGYFAPVGANLSVTKTDDADPVAPGATVTYTVTVANAGPRPASDVVATDTLPTGLTFVSTNGCDEDPAGVPSCSLGTIPAGGSVNYTVTATADGSTAATVTNKISVTSSTTDPDPSDNSATETTTVNDTPVITSSATFDAAEKQTAVATLTATDQFVPAQTLTWSESGGADASMLSITAGGVVSFDSAPDFENPGDADSDGVYEFDVEVADSVGAVASQTVLVTVTDENDAPVITSSAAQSADENQTAVATLAATDEDLPAQTLTWSEIGGADASMLSITAGGVVSFDSAPDFENPGDADSDGVYELDVEVVDGLGGAAGQTVLVTVTNGNEAPEITSDGGGATAAVSTPENTVDVTDVESTDIDGETENGGGLTYSLTGGADQALFTLDPATGVLTFTAAPDFEAPADADTDNDYEVQVTVTDAGALTDVQDITVTVTDSNEVPTITSDGGGDTAAVDAAENQTAVTDVDSIDNTDSEGSGLTYSITGGADQALFGIDPDTGELTFDVAPDFENPTDADTDNDYEVQVTVTDSGALSDAQDITVTITDVNDAPEITSSAAPTADENQTAVAALTATDQDLPAQTLTWTETGGADAGLLSITAGGVLTFDAAPDFENPTDANTNGVYVIDVQVSDGAGGVSPQTVMVFVTNVNELPSITSDGGGATAAVDAAENQTAVTDVQSSDLDGEAENGGGLTYSFTTTAGGGVDNGLFALDTATGALTFTSAPNFENPTDADTGNDYEVQVTVTDAGALTDVQDITVTVTNVNELPAITSDGGEATAAVNVFENQTAVTDVDSSDLDGETENGGGLTYSLTMTAGGGADNGAFTLNTATGVLTFTAAPNFETPTDVNTDNDYEVQVTVTDAGALTDVQDITVSVDDQNDTPSITSDGGGATAAIDAAENQTAVTDVQSSDPDGETENGGGLTYSFTTTAGGGADNGAFTLNTATGDLAFTAAPDFETPADANTDNDYEVQVTVTDAGALLDFQDITVTVTDLNELPAITSDGGGATASVDAAENQIAVTDVDSFDIEGETEGAGLLYSITGGADRSLFSIIEATGVLTFVSERNFENPVDVGTDNDYEVQVTVTDTGFLTDVQDITVTVTNVNELPSITSNGGAATASTDVAEGETAVTDVQSSDLDGETENGGGLTYSLTTTAGGGADNGAFTLDPATGVLTFTVAPNFETPGDADLDNDYEVQVTVTDAGGLTDVQDVTVTVTDVNEDAPVIASNGGGTNAALSIAENGTAVTDVDSSDPDGETENGGGLTYSLTTTAGGGADNGAFTLNTATGVLTFTASPNFEAPTDANTDNDYEVQVTVSDSGGLTDAQDITVSVTDVNDAPVITSSETQTADENQTAIAMLTATDEDLPAESFTWTEIGGADATKLSISPAGVLTFDVAPDFESPTDSNGDGVYVISVQVYDGVSDPTSQTIFVTVLDVNDAPIITSDGGEATAALNAAENQTAVTDVATFDLEGDGEGAGLTYSLTTTAGGGDDNGLFTLDPDTGALTFSASPDFETPADADTDNDYEVQVTVTDSATLTDVQDITVTVTDVNEVPSIISDGGGATATLNVDENQTAVTDVQSSDLDGETENGGGLTYSLTTTAGGGVDNGFFTLNTATGLLTFMVAPSFETPADADTGNDYEVQVTVTDAGALVDFQDITVTVDNVPEVPSITSDGGGDTAAVNADENQTAVTDVQSSDPDGEKENGFGLTYSLTMTAGGGVDNGFFTLNTATGLLTFTAAPDFETPADANTDNDYEVQVTVTDGAAQTDVQDISVTVDDINDAPIITSDGGGATAAVNVVENETAVTDVNSSDLEGETEDGGGLVYSLTTVDAGGVDNGLFTLHTATGVLAFTAAPDFENPGDADTDNDYEVQVTVTDSGPLTDVQDITVTVTDVNDAPVITSSDAQTSDENQNAVATLTATDQDLPAQTLTWTEIGGADGGLMSITSGGVLTFDTTRNFEDPTDANTDGVYEIEVQVSDGVGALTPQTVLVTLTNVNELPSITSDGGGATATLNVAENQTAVTDVESSDIDGETENGGGLTYSLTSVGLGGVDSGLFSVDADTGVVTFDVAPDVENPSDADLGNDYEVQVTVTDAGGLTDVQNITVTVEDVNDAPTITSSATFDADENQTDVGDVESSDQDGETEDGGGLVYSLTTVDAGGVDNGLFTLNTATGVLAFTAAPDFETPGDDNGDNDYEVQVTVTDAGSLTGVQNITVTVGDVNDAPTITSSATFDADENQTDVGDVESSDQDGETEDGGGLVYSLTTVDAGGVDNGLFTLNTATGVLAFTAAPDFETPGDDNGDNDYEVQVTVTDAGSLTGVQNITVTVGDVNDAPTITSSATFDADENQTDVGDVESSDQDGETEDGGGLVYSLTTVDAGGVDNGLFTLNTATGVLAFTAAPDFETPGDDNGDNDYEVQVTVTDAGSLTGVQNITVTVEDVNDAPTITSSATFDADENQTDVGDVESSDQDGETEDGGGLVYSLTTVDAGGVDNGLFTLNTATGVLAFTAAPDFETPGDDNGDNDYEVQVTVTDAGSLTGVQNITVTVEDVNDAPTITSSATFDADENQTDVGDVESSDQDGETEDGGGLVYSLTTVDAGGVDNGLFTLNTATGVLAFTAAPDFETPGDDNGDNDYEVQVTVTDAGSLTGVQNITVTVEDVNDAPTITSSATFDADENQTDVGDVESSDQDGETEDGGGLVYSLTTVDAGGVDNGLFTLNTATGVLAFTAAPDFETPGDDNGDNDYEVQVTVTDAGSLTGVQNITVTVEDVNDAPTITSSATFDADENQTDVGDVESSDQDGETEDGGGLVYSLTTVDAGGVDNGLFTLNTATGVLAFTAAPDFETPGDDNGDNDYEVQVTVTDAGSLTGVQNITVTVEDVNDAPTITSDAEQTADENQTAVAMLTATDQDLPEQTLTWSEVGGADADKLSITTDGVVTFDDPPDFENRTDANADGVYVIDVAVLDGAGGLTPQAVLVTVTDINEAPAVTSDGGGSTAASSAAENQTAVTDVDSFDVDGETENGGGLTYSLTGGADQVLFSLDADTGVLTFAAAPDFENPSDADLDNDYEVQVTVTDAGGLTDVQNITVTVEDVNDAPTITSSATFDADENQTAAGDVESFDQDGETENGGGLVYSFTTDAGGGVDNGLFTLDTATGVVTFDAAPDFENPSDGDLGNDYEVQVTVTDASSSTDVQDITITVTDVNEVPSITSGGGGDAASTSVAENGTFVTDVQSSDLDGEIENGGGLTYSLTNSDGGDDNALFTLNTGTGVLTFTASPDFETPGDIGGDNDYDVQVTVTDAGGLTDTQDITVTVTDVNDAPVITSDALQSADENQTSVATLTATDQDLPTQTLVWSETGGADADKLSITTGGVLTFDVAPDFENPTDADTDGVYVIDVQVFDGVSGLTNQTVSITVTNVNEAPEIAGGATAAVDAAEAQTDVTDVQSGDDSDSEASGLTYTLSGGADQSFFTIEPSSGVMTFTTAPDFETPLDDGFDNTYVVQVTVADSGDNPGPLADSQTITVTVTNVNDVPALAAIEGTTLGYNENAAATFITSTITVSDQDNANMASATVQITGGYQNGQDVLAAGALPGGIVAGAFNPTLGSITLTGSATKADYQTALRGITYRNTSDDPSAATRTATFTVNDGALNSSVQTRAIAVTPVNDAPVLDGASLGRILLIEDQGGFGAAATVLTNAGFNVTVANNEYAAGRANLLDGSFLAGFDFVVFGERGTGSGTVLPTAVASSLEDYVQAGGHLLVTGYDTLGSPTDANLAALVRAQSPSDQVSNNSNWVTAGVDNFILNGPFGDFRNLAFSATGYDDDALIADVGAGTVELASIPGATGRIIFNDLAGVAGSVGYWNGGLSGTTSNAQPDFSDGGNPQNIFLNWAAGVSGTSAVAYTENDDPTQITGTITVSDADNANLSSAVIQITGNYQTGEDVLDDDGSVPVGITVGVFNAAEGSITLSGSASVADYQAALRAITYANTSSNPSELTRTVTFTVNDGDDDSNTQTRDISVTAVA